MGVRFTGNGTGTSSISFTTIDLRAPTLSTSMPSIIDQVELLKSDAGIITPYKPGQRQLQFDFRWNLLNNTELEAIKEFLEEVDGSNNWFTLQDHFIPEVAKAAMPELLGTSSPHTLLTADNLLGSLWSDKPVGRWAFIMSGSQINQRRRIKFYGTSNITVDPGFAGTIAIGNTFLIGTPVIIMPGQIKILPRLNDRWDMSMTFLEKGD